jgi:protein-disulfide isomerase-like protein with CxxC motif
MTAAATAPDTGTEESRSRGALSQLIQDVNDRGLSYAKMSERAIDPDTGTRLSKPYLQRLVGNPPANAPSETQMRAIAAALRVSERRVQAAAAEQWLGYVATELAGYNDDVRIIVSHLGNMPEPELRRWRAMIEADERARHENELRSRPSDLGD